MSRHELSRSSKGLWQRIEARFIDLLPRQARVTRTEGNSVWVKFLGDGANDPESRFPSTVSGVPVATMGWVLTLGGKKGLFVATGVAVPIPFSSRFAPGSRTTTNINNIDTNTGVVNPTIVAEPGVYMVNAIASAKMSRSVQSGHIVMEFSVGTVTRVEETVYGAPGGYQSVSTALNGPVTVPESGEVTIVIGFRGGATSGTTNIYKGTIYGTLTRIG